MILLAFVAGCAMVLPVPLFLIPCILLGYLSWQYPIRSVLILCAMGMCVTVVHQWINAPKGLPDKHTIHKAQLYGEIIYIPRHRSAKLTIDVQVHQLNQQKVSALVRLTCYKHCPKLDIGDFVSMQANLKKPHDFQNSGHFPFQQWAWSNHINRIGSYQPKSVSILKKSNRYWLAKIRVYLYQGIQKLTLDADAKALMSALTIGISDDIRPSLWNQFRQTGTAHLMVISGAHVGLITGLSFYFFSLFWRIIPCISLYFPAQRFAAISAFLTALSYALIAGFAIPAQRAVIMSAVILYRYIGYQYLNSWQAWQVALFLCVCIEPHSLVMPGFYLSFIAVGILLVVNLLVSCKGIKKMIILQAGCLLGLMPLTLYLFNYQATNGLFANLILIPYVSLVLLPLALLKIIFIAIGLGSIGDWLFNQLIRGLMLLLTFFQSFSFLNWQFALQSSWQVCEILFGLSIIILLTKRMVLVSALILIITAFVPTTIRPKFSHAQVTVLDVGQGLSVLVSTQKHHLLYDTGMKFYGGGGDIGERVILPFLHYFAINRLDAIVISHPDLDHRGGLESISRVYSKTLLISDSPRYYQRGENCHSYPTWTWDGIHFEFLSLKPFHGQKNNHSCVLKISSPSRSLLLTGDIEREAESYLLQHSKEKLQSDIIIVPHHGSQTSSSRAFLKAVSPSIAVISAGLDNRYHFPHAAVLNRLLQQSARIKNTAVDGMVVLTL